MLVKRIHSRKIPGGAEIFEKAGRKYARWTMASGKTQTQPLNRKGNRVVEESRCWYVRFRHPDTGKWKEWKAYHDRQASQAMEMEILKKLERGEVGLIDPMTVHRKTAMDDHLMAFEAHLEDKGNTQEHIDKTISRCRRILGKINAKVVADITAEGVDRSLAKFRRAGMSLSTSNGYFRAMRTFCLWLVRTRRVGENPIAGLSCIRVTEADRKRRRRNLSDVEVQALLDATRYSKKTFMGLAGPDRAMLYIIAINTGLRASELASLTPESFELDGEHTIVRCHGGYTKNGAEAVLPLRRDIAEMLKEWLVDKSEGNSVWPGKWASHRHGAEMIRNDLKAAGVDYEDAHGRFADFHALRHTFISNLSRAGVHPRNAQALARHSTIELTMNVYTHVNMKDLADDIENLPSVTESNSTVTPESSIVHDTNKSTTTPNELANLASNWDSLPEHIRGAISTLAGV